MAVTIDSFLIEFSDGVRRKRLMTAEEVAEHNGRPQVPESPQVTAIKRLALAAGIDISDLDL